MSHKQSAQEWARTAHLPYPPRWGQIESELLARAGRPPGSTVVQIVALCVVLALLLVGYGAAGIGLVVIMVSDHPMDSGVVGLLQDRKSVEKGKRVVVMADCRLVQKRQYKER